MDVLIGIGLGIMLVLFAGIGWYNMYLVAKDSRLDD